MSLFAVKNDKSEWLYSDEYNDWVDQLSQATFYDTFEDADDDIECWELSNAHVVEIAESPAKIVVSEEEAKMLKKLDREIRTKSTGYSPWKWLSKLDDLGMAVEDAYKALAIGWTVEKPKRWNVKVPHTELYYWKMHDDEVGVCDKRRPEIMPELCVFTAAEIEHYGLQDCEREEVTDDDD